MTMVTSSVDCKKCGHEMSFIDNKSFCANGVAIIGS